MDRRPILLALASATMYGIGLPLSKLLLRDISPVMMAGLLYAGAFLGLAICWPVILVVKNGWGRRDGADGRMGGGRRDGADGGMDGGRRDGADGGMGGGRTRGADGRTGSANGMDGGGRTGGAEEKTGWSDKAPRLDRKDVPYLFGSIISGGVLAPVLLMMGLNLTAGFSASLLSNLEGVATAFIAVLFFRESTGRRLWLALACMMLGGILLSWNGAGGGFDSAGPVLIVLSMVCWGADNNLMRAISAKDTMQIATVKCLFAGAVPLGFVILSGGAFPSGPTLAAALAVGAFGYGASVVLFIRALDGLGASRTAALFGFAPFVGAVVSLLVLREWLGWVMLPAAILMALGAWLILAETHRHVHRHGPMRHVHAHAHDDLHHEHRHEPMEHVHAHAHGDLHHEHRHEPMEHVHAHAHGDLHRGHPHGEAAPGPHVHEHAHTELTHAHPHFPDSHHRHDHDN